MGRSNGKTSKVLGKSAAQPKPKPNKKPARKIKRVHDLEIAMKELSFANRENLFANLRSVDRIPEFAKIALNYVDPQANVRLPDTQRRSTATYLSTRSIPVVTSNVAGSEGKFFAAVFPKLGHRTQTDGFQVYMNSASTDFGVPGADWTSTASYADYYQGTDVRVDPNLDALTGYPGDQVYVVGGGVFGPANPLGTLPVVNNNPTLFTTDARAITWALSNDSFVRIPAGVRFCLRQRAEGTTLSGAAMDIFDSRTGADISGDTSYAVFHPFGNSVVNSAQTIASWTIAGVTIQDIFFRGYLGAGTVTSSFLNITISPQGPTDRGTVDTIRPVAQYAWFQCTLPEYNNGGKVAMYAGPSGAFSDSFWTNTPAVPGNLQNFSAMTSAATDGKNLVVEKLENGVYGYWRPEDQEDQNFHDVLDADLQKLPGLYISGYHSDIAGNGGLTIGQLIIRTSWEYTTTDLSRALAISRAPVASLEHAAMALAQVPRVMANDTHVNFLRQFQRWLVNESKRDVESLFDTLGAVRIGLLNLL